MTRAEISSVKRYDFNVDICIPDGNSNSEIVLLDIDELFTNNTDPETFGIAPNHHAFCPDSVINFFKKVIR